MSFPTVYYITKVIPSCYSAGYAMCVCVSFGACVYRSLGIGGRQGWYGHVMRKGEDGWVKKCMEFGGDGRRPVGRPIKT